MEIDAQDVDGVHFSLKPIGNRTFRLKPDFGERTAPRASHSRELTSGLNLDWIQALMSAFQPLRTLAE